MILFENCANSAISALEAQKGGAYRVELCDNLGEGGTTPALSQIELARQLIQIKLYVLIRPRGGDFLYSDDEYELIKKDIHDCGKAGCDGVVVGALNADGSLDVAKSTEMVKLAKQYNMGVTYHRAFDRCNDLSKALEQLVDMGYERVLTSGGYPTALEGADKLKSLIIQAGDRITIMPGSGVNEHNIFELAKKTGLKEFHGTLQTPVASRMTYKSATMRNDEGCYSTMLTDAQRVKKAIEIANSIL